jgi:excinuclease ABC subunit A
VDEITGLGPAVAVGQNLLNRNPNSTLATASGLHPFFRLLYARFGARKCRVCWEELSVQTVDEIVDLIAKTEGRVIAPILVETIGSHKTLLGMLTETYDLESIIVDGKPYDGNSLDPSGASSLER